MAMSRKDYVLVAGVLRQAALSRSPAQRDAVETITNMLAVEFKVDNPRFDVDRFLAAATGGGADSLRMEITPAGQRKIRDRAALNEALQAIRDALAVTVVTVYFGTSDQNVGYGFVLREVDYADERGVMTLASQDLDLTVWNELQGTVNELVSDINWNGVMGEDKHGDAAIDMPEGRPS